MVSERARRLTRFLRPQRETMCRLLERLAAAESPSEDAASQAAVQAILTDELCELDRVVRRIPGSTTGGHLLAVPRSRSRGRPIQLLVGHCDTVWPLGSLATIPIRRSDGRLRGPGVYDMKGGLVVMLFALRALREIGAEPAVTPILFINSDEEIGSHESQRHLVRLARLADRVLVLEPALGRRGKIKTARKGVGLFTIRVHGRSAHAGVEPQKGISAILELSHLVQELFALNGLEEGLTVNVGTIGGGTRPNVVPADGHLTVDVRIETAEQGERIERAIRALRAATPGAHLVVEGGIEKLPLVRTPGNRALWRLVREAGREMGLELQQTAVGGASDGNTTSLHAPTIDGLGPLGGGAHAAREFVVMDSLPQRAALLALVLLAPPLHRRSPGASDRALEIPSAAGGLSA